jgi:hypothetical protein
MWPQQHLTLSSILVTPTTFKRGSISRNKLNSTLLQILRRSLSSHSHTHGPRTVTTEKREQNARLCIQFIEELN